MRAVLAHKPDRIGFVMPRGFTHDRSYASLRSQIEKNYDEVELVSLPDRIFNESTVESSLLIARKIPNAKYNAETINVSCVTVTDNERSEFLKTGKIEGQQSRRRVRSKTNDDLWFSSLWKIWESLKDNRCLSDVTTIHRGLEWNYSQSEAWSHKQKPGYLLGIHRSSNVLGQFIEGEPVYLDSRVKSQRDNAHKHDWDSSKVILNAVRAGRGPWKMRAVPDKTGYACSKQFFGVWKKEDCPFDIYSLSAILNSPIANAFVSERMTGRDIPMYILKSLPLPENLDNESIRKKVIKYQEMGKELGGIKHEEELEALLKSIDAEILAAYDLPPQMERQLLDLFNDSKRPVQHQFNNYFPSEMNTWMSLQDYLNGTYESFKGDWIKEVFPTMAFEQAQSIDHLLP